MKYLISVAICVVLQSIPTVAQNSFTIHFKSYLVRDSTLISAGSDFVLAIKDSLSYNYYPSHNKNDTVSFPLGSSFIPKSTFVNVNRKLIISPYGYKGEPKTYALLISYFPEGVWKITNEHKIILGDTCIKAIGKLNGREIIAWYSPKLPAGFGIYSTVGLPGTILELISPETNLVTTAVSIIESSPDICEPAYYGKVLNETYIKKRTMSLDPKVKWKKEDFID